MCMGYLKYPGGKQAFRADLMNTENLTARDAKQPLTGPQKVVLYQGLVRQRNGNQVKVSSGNIRFVQAGYKIVFIDSNGREIGSGSVMQTWHTYFIVKINSGQVNVGQLAVIYK